MRNALFCVERAIPQLPRLLVAFIGGVLMAFGARMAGGCTSGHGISGALQLSVGSWVALICFFRGRDQHGISTLTGKNCTHAWEAMT